MGRSSLCTVIATVLAAAIASFAQSGPKSRILRPIEETQLQAIPGNVRAIVRPQFDQGRVDPSEALSHVALVFRPSAQQQQALDELLKEQQEPFSPNFHKWLTPEQYAARFGMSQSDLTKVAEWLQSQGLTYQGVSRSRTEIYFGGTVGQVEYALNTDIHHYLVRGEMHFSNATNPSLPAAFAGTVLQVRGLNDFRPQPRNVQMRRVPVSPEFTSNQTGNHFLSPNDFAVIYNVKPLYSSGLDGTGQSIAVLGQTTICPGSPCGSTNTADLSAYRAAAGLSPVSAQNFQPIIVPGSGSDFLASSGDEVESDLDVELSGGIAKNALVLFVYSGNAQNFNVWDALQYAVDQDIAPVISTSYGFCESGLGAFTQTVQQWAQQANAQGQTIVAAAGDQGAADCDSSTATVATQGLAVDVPASVPEVTGMGGNQFTGDAASTSTTQYWNGANDGGGGSALSYIPETAWNTTATDNQLSATGGGVSSVFSKPSWQAGPGVPNDGKRDVPDLSLNASPDHDGYLLCSQQLFTGTNAPTSCSNGFRASDGQSLGVVGGTSTAAPAFAAVLALINQATQSIGQGNVNPTLYALAVSNPNVFHDVTTGSNVVPCTKGTPNCPSASPFKFGYNAGTGYDSVTGLGSIDAANLLAVWPSSNGSSASTVTVTTSASPINPGGSVTFTATVASGSGGATPTGEVQFRVDGANAGPAVAISSGQATLSLSNLVGGSHAVLAVYSGDATYKASTSTAITEVVSDFSISGTPITVSAGNSGTSTITVSALNGFTGTVALTCTASNPNAQISCSLNPAEVSSATSLTSTLTVTTAAPKVIGRPSAQNRSPQGFGWFAATGGGFFAAIVVFAVPSRKRRHGALIAIVLVAFVAAGIGCGGGSNNSNSNSSGGVPATPTGLTATAGNAQVSLSWNAVSGAASYNVKRSTVSGGPYTTVASPTSTSYTDTSVTNGTPYYYVVSAVSSAGESNSSAQVTATPSTGGTPTGSYTITVTGTSGGTTHTASVALTVQ